MYGTRGAAVNGNIFSSGVDLLDGEWHHVAVTAVDDWIVLYVDGKRVGSGEASFLGGFTGLNSISIGRNKDSTAGSGGQWFFDGLIDDVRVYDTALTHDEIIGLAAVPEPAGLALLMAGMVGLLCRRRRGR